MLAYIFGIVPEPCGKSILATILGEILSERGFSIGFLKPISQQIVWRDWKHFLWCWENRTLVSRDVLEVRRSLGLDEDLEIMNPVHNVMMPLNLRNYVEQGEMEAFFEEENPSATLSMSRITTIKRDGTPWRILLFNSIVDMFPEQVWRYLPDFAESFDKVISFLTNDDAVRHHSRISDHAVSSCLDRMLDRYDWVIVEGFSDSLIPAIQILSADLILGLSPGFLAEFDPTRWRKRIDEMVESGRKLGELTSRDAFYSIGPKRIWEIPFEIERERVARVLEEIIGDKIQ